ncbi:cystathionine gamma-lyase [Sphingobacterium allocomposti]|jgi:cystathionine gamma-lyase|uniref:Cystathionine gamma-lyase n=1 Tax=Sphingobacterium allocomposti TaxID=415956 RepID=A0A5S5DT16_9SPHI|nr:cystathionine gamma-synthase [Sphingobacterium composti Yoo et al. 2007 non Ten et al. 2007]TYP97799.1 cystathionine gamma-lyase [Sphingobacterium composti Yoo et al. 2007 non Ten et al. 2007]HLS96361.1 cystathionine gamma-synthase [Sphingobacterium sp.]
MEYKFATKAIHAGQEADPATGAVMTPIYQTSTYKQASPGEHKGFEYSRGTNPTRQALEGCLAALENGKFGLAFASGMAATDTVLRLLKPGDEVLTGDDLYGGSYRIFTKVYAQYGINFVFVDTSDAHAVEEAITEKTKLIWVETPTNPTLKLADIAAIGEVAKKYEILYVVDNTFASPYLQNPLDLGADIVMHSATKYLNGHSDVVMGALVLNDEALYKQLWFYYNACGGTPGPQDAFLVLRGLKTLHVRMRAHCENGRKVAEFLKGHPKVERVYWPGFSDHPGHEIAQKQMRDFGGMVSIVLKDADLQETFRIASRFKVFTLAESLGGVESLVNHPATMTHGSIPKEVRESVGVVDNLLRLSVGIEDGDDLIADLEQVLGER